MPSTSRESTSRASTGKESAKGSANSGSAGYRFPGPNMRVSDAERTEVADCLSKHYSDGRLDETEFSKRLDRAMNATIQSDLDGLFEDLPGGGPQGLQHATAPAPEGPGGGSPGAPGGRQPRRGGRPGRPLSVRRVISLALLVVVTIVIAHALAHLFIPWVLIAVLIFVWFQFGARHHRGSPGA